MRTEAELQAVVAALNYDFTDFTLDHFITQVEADRQRTLSSVTMILSRTWTAPGCPP